MLGNLVVVSLLVLLPRVAVSREPPISAVEVKSLVVRPDRDLVAPLREAVEKELTATDLSKAPKNARFVLGAALVSLDTTTTNGSARASCRVSLTLRDAKGGSLRAIVDGSALVEDSAAATSRAELDAIGGAVHGAMRAIPDAIRKAE